MTPFVEGFYRPPGQSGTQVEIGSSWLWEQYPRDCSLPFFRSNFIQFCLLQLAGGSFYKRWNKKSSHFFGPVSRKSWWYWLPAGCRMEVSYNENWHVMVRSHGVRLFLHYGWGFFLRSSVSSIRKDKWNMDKQWSLAKRTTLKELRQFWISKILYLAFPPQPTQSNLTKKYHPTMNNKSRYPKSQMLSTNHHALKKKKQI